MRSIPTRSSLREMLGACCARAPTSDSNRWRDTLRNASGWICAICVPSSRTSSAAVDGSGGTGLRRGDDRDHGE